MVVDNEGVAIADVNVDFRNPLATAALTVIVVNMISPDLDAEAVTLRIDRDDVLIRHVYVNEYGE
jgi:hypothetical protein